MANAVEDRRRLEAELVTLAKALDERQSQIEEQQTQLARLAHTQQHKDNGLQQLLQQVTDLLDQQQCDRQELHVLQQHATQQQHDLQLHREQEDAATMAVHDVTARLDRTVRQLEEAEQAKDALHHAHCQLQREVEVLRNRAELSPSEVVALNNTLEQQEAELEASRNLNITLEERCQALRKHNEDLQETCQDWEQAHQTLRTEMQTVQAQMETEQLQLNKTKEQHQQQVLELTTAVANAQEEQRRHAQQQRFAMTQCHRDVLDAIQVINQTEKLSEQSLPTSETTADQGQQLRSSVEQLKQHVLWQHRSMEAEARELNDQCQGLQVRGVVWHDSMSRVTKSLL